MSNKKRGWSEGSKRNREIGRENKSGESKEKQAPSALYGFHIGSRRGLMREGHWRLLVKYRESEGEETGGGWVCDVRRIH